MYSIKPLNFITIFSCQKSERIRVKHDEVMYDY